MSIPRLARCSRTARTGARGSSSSATASDRIADRARPSGRPRPSSPCAAARRSRPCPVASAASMSVPGRRSRRAHDLLVAQPRQVEGVDQVPRVQREGLARGRDHERVVDGSPQDPRLVAPPRWREPSADSRYARRPRRVATARPVCSGIGCETRATACIRQHERAILERPASARQVSPDRLVRPCHARSSFATWLVRTTTASTEIAARRPHRPGEPAEREAGDDQRVPDPARARGSPRPCSRARRRAPARRTTGSSRTSAASAPAATWGARLARRPGDRRQNTRRPTSGRAARRASGRARRPRRGSRDGRRSAGAPPRRRRTPRRRVGFPGQDRARRPPRRAPPRSRGRARVAVVRWMRGSRGSGHLESARA